MTTEHPERPKHSMRDLPVEIHEKIMGSVASRSDLRSCTLTQRVWRYSAQKALHRVVKVFGNNFDIVLPRYTPSPPGDQLAMDLSGFPRSLVLQACRCNSCFGSDELAEFARYCGERIESLEINSCSVDGVRDILGVVGKFPFLQKLRIIHCTWKNESLAVQNNPDIPPPPATLDTVFFFGKYVESPIARWLVQTPGLKISTAHWTCNPVHHKAMADSSAFFREIGRSLTHLTLWFEGNWDETSPDSSDGNIIDLSLNTCLSQLTVVEGHVPGKVPRVLSTVNSPVLETLELRLGDGPSFHHKYKYEIRSIVQLISQSGKFGGLRTLVVRTPNKSWRSRLLWMLSCLCKAGIAVEIPGFERLEPSRGGRGPPTAASRSSGRDYGASIRA